MSDGNDFEWLWFGWRYLAGLKGVLIVLGVDFGSFSKGWQLEWRWVMALYNGVVAI